MHENLKKYTESNNRIYTLILHSSPGQAQLMWMLTAAGIGEGGELQNSKYHISMLTFHL